jgi:hypothetical protein
VAHIDEGSGKTWEGIKLLLNSHVQSEAIHDSGARGTLGCHPGTREEYIRNITGWGSGEWESEKCAFLMTGPAGAGKTAIASSCAGTIKEAGNFGASFFFYRPSGWNDPKKFIPTIVYQLTTRYPAYRDYIDAVILDDRLVLQKAMDVQFRELLVKPLQKLSADGEGVGREVVIIDGLDECATVDAQIEIINLIGTSIREQTTPFIWAFFSRPEPPITSTFSSEIAASIAWKLPLTLSGNADSDIEAYLRGGFEVIRAKYSIPANVVWPMGKDIHHLVSQSAGLFIYAATAIRYIDGLGKGRSGLEERLRAVLQLDSSSTESPFSALDQLYLLVMKQIPEGVLSDTMSLLRLDHSGAYQNYMSIFRVLSDLPISHPRVVFYRIALGLSSAGFHVAIGNLYSLLEVTKSPSGEPAELRFYHKSFVEFLLDPKRSKEFSIKSPTVQQHCLEMIVRTMSAAVDADAGEYSNLSFEFDGWLTWFDVAANTETIDGFLVQAFFTLVEEYDRRLEESILQQISQVNWNSLRRLSPNNYRIDFANFIPKV